MVHSLENPERLLNIAFVGKYVDLTEIKSLTEALIHAGIHTRSGSDQPIDSEEIEGSGDAALKAWTPFWCRADSASAEPRKIIAIRYARRTRFPISASALVCSSRLASSTHATLPASSVRTAPNSRNRRRIR